MNEFDALQLAIDLATKHGAHNQKKHGTRVGGGGPVMIAGARVKFGKAKPIGGAKPENDSGSSAAASAETVAPAPPVNNRVKVGPEDATILGTTSAGMSSPGERADLAKKKDDILQKNMDFDFTTDERKAMGLYGTDFHNDLNGHLAGRALKNGSPENVKKIEKNVALMDQAMEKSRVPGTVVMYRGTNASPERLAQLTTPGAVISSPEFYSTSSNIDHSKKFAKSRPNLGKPHRVVMNITIPAGAKAVNMNAATRPLPGRGGAVNEEEVVLPRNSRYVVKGYRTEGDITHVDLEVIVDD
jgi:hypothetical protein